MAKKTRGVRMAKVTKLAKCTKGGKGKIANRPAGRKVLKT
jgi:hypothetical protein